MDGSLAWSFGRLTWGKLGIDTPKFIIESDATIVAPLIFAYLLAITVFLLEFIYALVDPRVRVGN